MASLSLPRVLQLKKNSLDAEREQFEKFQTLAIQKAINSIETPVKEKHVRSTIIGTFQEQSAITYWMVAVRLPLQDNRIVAWKFCHVTHKLLREGHPACLDDSQRHISMIENLGKLWVHLREGYGKLVHLYCNLLVVKLKFHARNPRFPGNLQLTADELDAIAENDVNIYFQLCVELFDYMDEILSLQAAVFDSLGNARANSMTASGQCRLAALIPCAQDSSQIYDCNVRLLFRLHASLPADTLSGHRERFRQQFKKLSSFYKHASSLQYYRNLLTLPVLPSNPPNFLLQSDFGTYVPPVVSIPDPQPDEVDSVGSLIDTSDTISQVSQAASPEASEQAWSARASPSPQPDPVLERDRLIDHLQHELRRMRAEVTTRVEERNNILGAMRELSTSLETQLHAVKTELEQERRKSHMLSVQTPEIQQKLADTEDKAKLTDEKFQKLKGAYTQLREEHINLIRQKAEVDKLTASLRAATAQHESAKTALQQQLNDRMKDVELLQQSASSSEEIEAYKNEILSLRVDLENSRQKETELESLRASMEALQIEHNTSKTEQEDKLNTLAGELKETKEILDNIKQEKDERETELSRVKEELIGLREKSGDEYKKVVEEKEAALKQVAELTQEHQLEKEEQMLCNNKYQSELEDLHCKLIDAETKFSNNCEVLKDELDHKSKELESIVNAKDDEIEQALGKLVFMQKEIKTTKKGYEEIILQKSAEIGQLSDKINELNQCKLNNDDMSRELIQQRDMIQCELNDATQEIESLTSVLTEKTNTVHEYEKLLSEKQVENKTSLEELENKKNEVIAQLKDELCLKDIEIVELESKIDGNNKEIEKLLSKSNDVESTLEQQKTEYDIKLNDKIVEITILNDKLKNVIECKDEIIENMKTIVEAKDNQVIALNIENTKLSECVVRLEDELKESQAELEIGRNEFLSLKEEHDNFAERNESNLILKNKELRELNNKILKLTSDKDELMLEKEKLLNECILDKQVFKTKIKENEEAIEQLQNDYQNLVKDKEKIKHDLSAVIDNLKSEYDNWKIENDNKTKSLCDKIEEQDSFLSLRMSEKDKSIAKAEEEINNLKAELEGLQIVILKEKEDMGLVISEKDNENKTLEAKLDMADNKRLNAESELQDMLQQNTVLEADIATLKIQLEEARRDMEKQSTRIVTCAGDAALGVTADALAVLDGANEADHAAADLAAKALDELAKTTQVKGNEESVAKSAVLAAHSTAQLAARLSDLANTATDLSLSEKLNTESRTMLTATKQCLEAIRNGSVSGSSCVEARGCVLMAAQSAAAAARNHGGALSVEDELAGMDRAIEEAAEQIESLLAASRAADSGLKLEVNGNILDACTTLMAAVKVLVQDSRKLQNELGDPITRQNMYRKNPQWSEGLISASKAVVFAAKLLVTSADEAVGASGRFEGVSAAAHEVAGSTAQLVAASRARAPPVSQTLSRLTAASRSVAAATGALVAAVRAAAARSRDSETMDTSALTLTATRRLEMESKVRSLELEVALDAERAKLAALRKRHYQLAQLEENGNMTNGKE